MLGKLSELKLNKIRKVFEYEIEGVKKQITLYNPTGKKREGLVELLQNGSQLEDKDKAAEMLYKSLLKELVDIEVDTKGVKSLLKAPSQTLLELNYEIDEILYELQYEFITNKLRQLNSTKIGILTAASLSKVKEIEEDVEKIKNDNI